jgi:hypothetical protein
MTVLMIDLMLLLSYDYDVELYSSFVVALVTIIRDSVLFLSWLSKKQKRYTFPLHII